MNDTVPRESSVVDDDVNLAIAELGSLLHQLGEVRIVEHIAWNGNSASSRITDLLCDC